MADQKQKHTSTSKEIISIGDSFRRMNMADQNLKHNSTSKEITSIGKSSSRRHSDSGDFKAESSRSMRSVSGDPKSYAKEISFKTERSRSMHSVSGDSKSYAKEISSKLEKSRSMHSVSGDPKSYAKEYNFKSESTRSTHSVSSDQNNYAKENSLRAESSRSMTLYAKENTFKAESSRSLIMAHQQRAPALKTVKNIVLVGRTGNGKSATGNTLIGKQVFLSEERLIGVTRRCQTYEGMSRSGSTIKVIDTPGLYDGSVSNGSISKEIINCLKMAEGGFYVVVLVLSVSRFTKEEGNTLHDLYVLFGNEIVNYLIVIFTGGDKLEAKGKTLGDYLREGCPEILKEVLNMCDHRRVMFNNKTSNEDTKFKQLERFYGLVREIEERTHGKPFTGQIQRNLKEETERFTQQKKAIEARNLGERELAKMKQQQVVYERRLTELENEVKNKLQEISKQNTQMMNVITTAALGAVTATTAMCCIL